MRVQQKTYSRFLDKFDQVNAALLKVQFTKDKENSIQLRI
jgi:hypothetical protein